MGCTASATAGERKLERSDTAGSSRTIPTPRHTISSKLNLPVVDIHDFLDFCETKLAGENVKFYIALDDYEKMFDEDASEGAIAEAAEDIVIRFLSDKSRNEISVDALIKQAIMKAFEESKWAKDTFRAARIEVVTTLQDQFLAEYEEKWLASKA